MTAADSRVRHVFQGSGCGEDRIRAWMHACGEPVFEWTAADAVTVGGLGWRFDRWLERTNKAEMTLYHDPCGVDILAPRDPLQRKALVIHSWPPRWQALFAWALRFCGKVVVATDTEKRALAAALPWIPERFIGVVSAPLLRMRHTPEKQQDVTGIWLHGRQWQLWGDRLRAVVDRWQRADHGELEILADGGSIPRWNRGADAVNWRLNLSLDEALERSSHWSQCLLLQDVELDAPWLLEQLQRGSFPLIPDGDSPVRGSAIWQEDGAPQAYPWGDMEAALELLAMWRATAPSQRAAFADWTRRLLAPDQDILFTTEYSNVVEEWIQQRPLKLASRGAPFRLSLLRWYLRVYRFRSGRL